MNFIIGAAVIISALYLRIRYRHQGRLETELFLVALAAGVISMLTLESYATIGQLLWPVIDVTLSAAIVGLYRAEVKRQAAVRETQRETIRREAVHAQMQKSQQARMRSRASVMAMFRSAEAEAIESMAA